MPLSLVSNRTQRPCQSCYKLKVKCDGDDSTCLQCLARGLECIYDDPARSATSASGTKRRSSNDIATLRFMKSILQSSPEATKAVQQQAMEFEYLEPDIQATFTADRTSERLRRNYLVKSEVPKDSVNEPLQTSDTTRSKSQSDILFPRSSEHFKPVIHQQPAEAKPYARKPISDHNAPEKPPSAYVLFSHKVREEVKSEDLSFVEIAKLVGDRWQALHPSQKESFEKEAATLKERYSRELWNYMKTDSYRQYMQYLHDFQAKHRPSEHIHSDLELSLSGRPHNSRIAQNLTLPSRATASEDSGYGSELGTTAESVGLMDSIYTVSRLSPGFLRAFTVHFTELLIDKADARVWALVVSERFTFPAFEQRMSHFLVTYAQKLMTETLSSERQRSETGDEGERVTEKDHLNQDAIRLVAAQKSEISSYFYYCLQRLAVKERLKKRSTPTELYSLSAQEDSDASSTADTEVSDEIDPDETRNQDCERCFTDLEPMKEFLTAGNVFQNLLSAIRTLYFDDVGTMNKVKKEILTCLYLVVPPEPDISISKRGNRIEIDNRSRHFIRVRLHWRLQEFIKSQYRTLRPCIGSLVVLVGSAFFAQATTFAKYLDSVWSETGTVFSNALQAAVDNGWGDGNAVARVDNQDNVIAFRFSASTDEADICTIHGHKDFIVNVSQMLAFTGAAFNLSSYSKEVVYCEVSIESSRTPEPNLSMSFVQEELHWSEDPCWCSMFDNASIARNFPISDRGTELGVDISIELMAAIAGIRHIVEYEDGVVMKGFSSAFVPTKRCGDRVQWHMVSSDDLDMRISYQEAVKRCPKRATLEDVNLENIQNTRAIVGWCGAAHKTLGSAKTGYDIIDYSTAQQASTCTKIAGGSLGFQQIGLAQLDFTLGVKDGKCHFQRQGGPFRRIVSAAEKTPIVLYDTSDKRAWLVSAVEVMLHMAHHRHVLEPCKVDNLPVKLLATDTEKLTASEILLRSANMDLSDVETYKFKDMITNIWSLLEFLIDQNVTQDRTAGANITSTVQDTIRGFEFKAVVQERSPFRQKQTSILKSCGGWPSLARDIDALVLFASGFGDVVRPIRGHSQNKHLCHMWSTMPKDKDYLATSIRTLDDLYDASGHKLDRKYLTSTHLQWHKGRSSLFEPCNTPGKYICKCDRLQQIVPKSAIGQIIQPGPLLEDGAVIFGQSESPLCELGSSLPKSKTRGIYSQPNTTLELQIPLGCESEDVHSSIISDSDTVVDSISTTRDSTNSSCTPYESCEDALLPGSMDDFQRNDYLLPVLPVHQDDEESTQTTTAPISSPSITSKLCDTEIRSDQNHSITISSIDIQGKTAPVQNDCHVYLSPKDLKRRFVQEAQPYRNKKNH